MDPHDQEEITWQQPIKQPVCLYLLGAEFRVAVAMPVPVDTTGRDLPPLPKIYGEDRRVNKPEEYFRHLTRYRYARLLGQGAAAMDQQTGHAVAIKRINQISSLLVARRTLRELKLLRHFQGHPNIIAIRDLFLQNPLSSNFDELYIAQELMDADMCHIIQSKYPLSEEHCKRFLYQLLRGLKALHSANVIHRDLKPGNILWKHNGELRICDFGLARGLSEPLDGTDLTLTNYVATRWYRPPEILLYRTSYGKPLDIWSVGCIFAEMLGRKVFLPGQSGFEQLHLILQKLGTPSDEVIERIPSTKSKSYLKRLPRYPAYPLAKRFPNASLDDCILEEIGLYRVPRPETPLSLRLGELHINHGATVLAQPKPAAIRPTNVVRGGPHGNTIVSRAYGDGNGHYGNDNKHKSA
ncbi:Mitogen-activated protein kinase [Paramicrosporidium saccamoebae]|uniref:Mitogen-activated protein kinase n=1 Tax=Paramicrosporidium saccamoebae TaxID=1246581 RepID=A0A2H9TGX1_9FUNG|nr:Mitogen-activated protein kinase [Paramicrosporidium saccamoebae]